MSVDVGRRPTDLGRGPGRTTPGIDATHDQLRLTLPIAKARGFSVRRHEPPSEVLQWLPERSLLRGGSGVPRPTYPHPGHLTTCQVVQVHGRAPGGSLATLGSRSWLMFYVRTFSPQPPTSSCQKANPSVSGASPFASNVYRNHHSFNYAGKPAIGRLISPWLKPGALRRNLVSSQNRSMSISWGPAGKMGFPACSSALVTSVGQHTG